MSADFVAGRELDERVARDVLGLALRDRGMMGLRPAVVGSDGRNAGALPRYSADIAAAWRVVEELAPSGADGFPAGRFTFVLSMDGTAGWYARFSGLVRESEGGSGQAASAPLAVCLAALEAVGASRPEGA